MNNKKGLIYHIINNWRFTIFFTILAIVWGIYSYYIVPKQESPDISAPFAVITTIYPGASPEDVEKLVSRVIEDEIREVPGYKSSHSITKNSLSVVVLELHNDADVKDAWNELGQILDGAQGKIPSECFDIEMDTKLSETAGMIISLSGEGYTYEQLADYADQIKSRLAKIDGISRFTVAGVQNKVAQIEVKTTELNKYNLSLTELVSLIQAQNLQIPSGSLSDNRVKINVSSPGLFTSLSDLENMIIDVSAETGAPIRLKDLAEVRWDIEDSSYQLKHNGQNTIMLSGFFEENRNILLIGEDVRAELDRLKSELPAELILDEVVYQPTDVEKSVAEFFKNLLEGMALVLIVVFLGMGFKNALVASTAVPLSIIITFIAMYLLGIQLQEISIAALILALGILVDDAIVIIDAIQVHIDQGFEKMEACIRGMKQSVIPVFSATLTIVAAFSPMLFVPGPAGEFLRSLPQTVIIAVTASFLVAITVTPVLAYLFFDKLKGEDDKQTLLRRVYGYALRVGMKYKKSTVCALILLIAIASYGAFQLHIEFFPKADKNVFYINLYSESASDISATARLADQVEEVLKENEEIMSYSTALGGGLPKFYIALPKAMPSKDFAQIMLKVDLAKGKFNANEDLALHLQEQLDQRLIGGSADVLLLEKALPGDPLEVRVSGDDPLHVRDAVTLIRQELEGIPGAMKVADDYVAGEYEFVVDVDTERATTMGITNYDIQRQINIALSGTEASLFRIAGNEYPIMVQSDVSTKEDLENLGIKSSLTGNKVLLKQLGEIHLQSTVPTINKYDGVRAVTISGKVQPGFSAVTIENTLKQRLVQSGFDFSGLTVSYEGEAKDIKDNFGNLGTTAIFALFLIYVILMIQFRSFLQPAIIFITIPLSIIGVVAGLMIFAQPLSFTALVGVVSLMGLVIRNAILLIEFINLARVEGMSIDEACTFAVNRRYRPIILAAVTTVIGLVPLAFSGSDLFTPMSVALMSGLLISTLFTLIVVPIMYSILVREERGIAPGAPSAGKIEKGQSI
ncbi:MAG TPA: efflux RND transporter permease subunit [Desulfitobacterium dehalogenans]|uniref:Efflux RND transporter permease subunit n=1 Tax=Desulfitobacterium dehalogenans TaxID=36854 RepID=A0A7C6Z3L5_9FIRM|nr:efflux RND transporter permease subunit [Desulfitobacterium dehalogenans]